ncbi:sugar lactone lactonase YvrE [Rubricella aquisinus]|uniref:Sugar lactone lactonase YvrE n=1 Tax=Rubricella aquisinus TaxID=2028108 RepID=A0A840WK55_9RHOB|nr:SMP-30/gluconolactonase/LRE family protein [Rubricella aquisinus]MBB5515478.1 sugar lactone lactonase YvrE [Rubricella aquisinus]
MILRIIRLFLFIFLFALGTSWLLFSPVEVDAVAWSPERDQGFTGDFALNERLAPLQAIPLGGSVGPEDIAVHSDGSIWTTTQDGILWRVEGRSALEVGRLTDRPLGLEFGADDALYIADPTIGLLRWTIDGGSEVLLDRVNGAPLRYINQLDVGSDGSVYFSVSTQRFDPATQGGTLATSILDLWEHRDTGYVARWRDGEVTILAEGFTYTNGVALTPEEDALIIAETGGYRIWRLDLATGTRTEILTNLPGFPDNVQAQGDGTFWVGLVSPRRKIADVLAPFPTLREVIWRLPEQVRPTPIDHGILMRIDGQGQVLDVLHDADGAYPLVTGGRIVGDLLYVSSLGAPGLGVLAAP